MTRILVAYATKYGATAEIADAVAAGIRDTGAEVEVRPAKDVRDLTGVDAVVVGAGVYMNRWHGDGLDFLKRFERELAGRPTWLFSSGPTGGDPKAEAKLQEILAAQPPAPGEAGKRAAKVGARGQATFAGRVDDTTAKSGGIFARFIPRGDWIDRDAARQWGASIGQELQH
jgi:menaquinone-dependent protoporphyrinogen oxidase